MKRILFLTASLLLSSCWAFSQENELPETGNVGIGTTQPTHKLDVRGGARIDSTVQIGDSLLIMSSAEVGEDLKVAGNAIIEGDLNVSGISTLEKTLINGQFILPNLPAASSADNVVIVKDDGTINKINVLTVGTASYKDQQLTCPQTSSNPTWLNGVNKIFSPCPDVFVGIATNTPLYNLDVRGKGYFASGLQIGDVLTGSSGTPAMIEGERNASVTGPLMRLSLKNSSGVAETRFKIENDGTVYCTSVRVRPTAAIPDYVFKPDYKLMPLNDLREFVQENSHLPNVPSEAEILKNDLSLDEMQLKLLEKVEELTLYMLEMDTRSEALETENAELRAELEELKAKIAE